MKFEVKPLGNDIELKVCGYNVTIYEKENGYTNIRITRNLCDGELSMQTMIVIYRYLVIEGFITDPFYKR